MMHSQIVDLSVLTNPTDLPLRSVTAIAADRVLVVAPHPDDETLGCGGAITLLCTLGCSVQVLVISDGTLSHPNSHRYPAMALRELRESETREALAILGGSSSAITFLRLRDGSIPTSDVLEFRDALVRCHAYLKTFAPQIIFLPWRNDPHPDHRATTKLIQTALIDQLFSPRLIEYPIWDWDPEQRGDFLDFEKVVSWRLDTLSVLETKLKAIAAYRSQTTNLIDDDPEGFRLTPAMLENFAHPWEVYLEEIL